MMASQFMKAKREATFEGDYDATGMDTVLMFNYGVLFVLFLFWAYQQKDNVGKSSEHMARDTLKEKVTGLDEEDESGVELTDVSVVEVEVKERRSSSCFSVKNPMARKPREHSIAQQHPPTEIQKGSDDNENM
jgi:hypothetical protein